jgi:predicted flavoprotein YhiN
MMVAATLCEKNADAKIILFEKNKELGTKVRISGGGRCNVTT